MTWDLTCAYCGCQIAKRNELPDQCPNVNCPSRHSKEFKPEGSNLIEKIFSWKDYWRFAFFPGQEILDKIQKIEANGGKCQCFDGERVCPCEQSVMEVLKDGHCYMWMFCGYKYGHEYNVEYDYTDSAGVRVPDNQRLALQREKDTGPTV